MTEFEEIQIRRKLVKIIRYDDGIDVWFLNEDAFERLIEFIYNYGKTKRK